MLNPIQTLLANLPQAPEVTQEQLDANDQAIYAQKPWMRTLDDRSKDAGNFLGGLTGLKEPPPGLNPGTMGVAAGMLLPLLKGANPSVVREMLNLEPVSEPAGALIGNLVKYKAPRVTKDMALRAFKQEGLGTIATSPTTKGQMFNRMLSRVPEAEGSVELGQGTRETISRPRGINTAYQRRVSAKGRFDATPDEVFNRELVTGKYDRPSVKDYNDVADALAGPQPKVDLKVSNTERPTLIRDAAGKPGGYQMDNRLKALERSGLTEDMVREIRSIGLNDAIKKYPAMKPATIKDIANKHSWVWVKD